MESLSPTDAVSVFPIRPQVVFSVRSGDKEPIRARMKFASEFTVCDNRWHSVNAYFVQNQVGGRRHKNTFSSRVMKHDIRPLETEIHAITFLEFLEDLR